MSPAPRQSPDGQRIGRRLRALRLNRQMRQEDVANRLGISADDVAAILAGDAPVDEIARRRDVQPFTVRARLAQAVLIGQVGGDQLDALLAIRDAADRFARWIDDLFSDPPLIGCGRLNA